MKFPSSKHPVVTRSFPKDFLWGAATSAYQIEGAVSEGGRTFSIWDTFCRQSGKVFQGHLGDQACQHYRRWEEDIKIMQDLGINSYRFSISWSRIFPDSSKKINQQGIDFYNRLIDKLLASGIQPFITMFHWDLPQYIQDAGGWTTRDTCELFKDYAYVLVQSYADRVHFWTTLNEPSVVAFLGYFWGVHAPGERNPEKALAVCHHLLLAHGMAVQAIRSHFNVTLGITLNMSPVFPVDPHSLLDCQAAYLFDTYLYRSFLDALFLKKYPTEMPMEQWIFPQDMELISLPLDYLGINYYTTTRVTYDEKVPLLKGHGKPAQANPYSDIWEFYPQGLSKVIERAWNEYHVPCIYILENGTTLSDEEEDQGRIKYIQAHLKEVSKCLQKGIAIKGYFVWSLMDNFEWAEGYSKRFGLYYVNFDTLERRPKASARWYANLIKTWKTKSHHRDTKKTEKE